MHMIYLGIGIVVFALLVGLAGLVVRGKAKRILAAPLRRTGEATALQGPASFEGAVRTQQPLTAPVSGRPCVYFDLRLEHQIKERKGTTTSTQWHVIGKPTVGSRFWLDDGSGMLAVAGQGPLDADLVLTFSGPPPGGAGLGALEQYTSTRVHAGQQVLGYRVTEKIIPVDATLFALGEVRGGELGNGANKLMVSTRGRDALVGATQRLATVLFVLAASAVAGGAVVAVVRPGEAHNCGELVDTQSDCRVTTEVTELVDTKPDGTKVPYKMHQAILSWQVTKPGQFQLTARPLHQTNKSIDPVLQVEDSLGLPMNLGVNFAFSAAAANDYKTKTLPLRAGTYHIYARSAEHGPDDMVISIAPLAAK